ncbi:alpha/beta hydrolase, partial [Nocardioides hankookensis]
MAALSPDVDSPDNGTLEVQSLDAGTDHARHIVYLPGTDDLGTLPWTQDDDIRDLGSDLRSAAGEPTSYQRGILDAMHQAGIGPHEPVLLVGHSLGGMEAAALASRDTGFAITDVVTAGSPTAQVDGFPHGVHVLSLEHRGD